jgi:protein SCO1
MVTDMHQSVQLGFVRLRIFLSALTRAEWASRSGFATRSDGAIEIAGGRMNRQLVLNKLVPLSALGRALCSAVLSALLVICQLAPCAATSSVTIGGPFNLTAPNGTTVTDQTYRGKWLLVYFGYTFCPDTCPTTLLEITTALEKLGPDAAKVQPIFITVDPKRDTADVLAQYTQSFDPRIVGLTGTPAQIATVAHEYGAYYVAHRSDEGANDYLIDHSTYIYVMDPQGRFVQAFDADTPADHIADNLLQDMKREGKSR